MSTIISPQTITEEGVYTVFITADSGLKEHDDSNNHVTREFTVYPRKKLDVQIIEAPSQVETGSIFTFTANVTCLLEEGCSDVVLVLDPYQA